MTVKKFLVTSALPYANGDLHLGHMLEHIQSDIWVRSLRKLGHECVYICATDAHGTPIMLSAEKQNKSPEALIEQYRNSHMQDLIKFEILYDNFHTTHSRENTDLVQDIYTKLQRRGDIVTKDIEQAYDKVKQMFLPDRYVKGTCPKCGALDQYGDGCEKCSAHFSSTELLNPKSVLSGDTPSIETSTHYFFKLTNYAAYLKDYLSSDAIADEVKNKLMEWLDQGLMDWDISRDAPYFGIPIPGVQDKYFYVWLDAPIGYIASFKNYADKNHLDFAEYWGPSSTVELVHFIGKDIIYFHGLFWPAVLHASSYRTPSKLFVHGFLNVNGAKMSKSRGTFITANDYLKHLDPMYLRYYFAAKLTNKIDDVDFNLEDFVNKINADLVGKFINIASRCSSFMEKFFSLTMATSNPSPELWIDITKNHLEIFACYVDRDYAKAIRMIMETAATVNKFIDDNKPWNLVKDIENLAYANQVCSFALNCFKYLSTCLSPVMPVLASKIDEFMNAPLNISNIDAYLLGHKINKYEPLIKRLELKEVNLMLESNVATKEVKTEVKTMENIMPLIDVEHFSKVDLRIVKILNAEEVEGSDKLLRLTVDINEDQPRQIFAGIKEAYKPSELIGRYTVVVANLAPRKMRFGISEGMVVLAGGLGNGNLWLLSPDDGAMPGMKVK